MTPRWVTALQLAVQAADRGITSDDLAEHLGIPTSQAAVVLSRLRSETPDTYNRPVLLTRGTEVRQSVRGGRCAIHRITPAGSSALAAYQQTTNQPDNPQQERS